MKNTFTIKSIYSLSGKGCSLERIVECFKSVCNTCIIQMQDYLELDDSARFNVPSTLGGNWLWRARKKDFSNRLAERIARLVTIYYR